MKTLRHAIIGTGGISGKHFYGYQKTPGVETVALCDIDEARLKKASETYGVSDICTDYREILARDDIDMVSVCLPNYLHAPVTIQALEAGKHVHCEKPMAMSGEEAQAMLEAKKRTGKKLMIGLNNRFTPYALYLKGLCNSSWFGDIYFIKCGWQRRSGLPFTGWFADRQYAGGGALIDLGVHFIDLGLSMMNYPAVESVTAKTYKKFGGSNQSLLYAYQQRPIDPRMKFDVEDLATGFITLKNDAAISFEISWASNIETERNYLEIYGSKGGARFENNIDRDPSPTVRLFTSLNGQLVDVNPYINPNAYTVTEFSHFADSIFSGTEPVLALPQQGVMMMHIIDAIYASSQQHRPIMF